MTLAGTEPTPILDWRSAAVQSLLADASHSASATTPVEKLRVAHRLIAERVRPVYAVEERQPASRTIVRGAGSCSQRLAVLEAVARGMGIATRVRGLLVDGRFWHPRFPRLRVLVPDTVLIAWPEFLLDGTWLSVSELYGSLASLDTQSGFTNTTGETLFEAVSRTAVDWDGLTCSPGADSPCDLSGQVVRDLGRFESRDQLFDEHGQTLCAGARMVAGPVLWRRSVA